MARKTLMINTAYKNADIQPNWAPLGIWCDVCEEECHLEAPLSLGLSFSERSFLDYFIAFFPVSMCQFQAFIKVCRHSFIPKAWRGLWQVKRETFISSLRSGRKYFLEHFLTKLLCDNWIHKVCHHPKCI